MIQDYTAGSLDFGSSLAAISVAPGVSHRRAFSKRSDKYYFVTSGEIEFVVGDEKRILRSGDVALVRQGAEFSYRNESSETASLVLFHSPSFDLASEVFVS